MTIKPRPGERYLVRRKFWAVAGASFQVFGEDGGLVAFCRQKAFKLREDIRIYTDESRENELLVLSARSIIDFGTTYDVTLPSGERIGSFRRKGMKSSFIRDEWRVFDEQENQIGLLQEQGGFAFARHWIDAIAAFVPQKFLLTLDDGLQIARFRQHFNPIILNLGVTVINEHEMVDDLMILAAACLLGAIEGRQRG